MSDAPFRPFLLNVKERVDIVFTDLAKISRFPGLLFELVLLVLMFFTCFVWLMDWVVFFFEDFLGKVGSGAVLTIFDEYDTSFYIDDKYRYEKISDFKQDETNNFFYVIINGEKKYLDNNLNIYVKKDNAYLPIDKVFIYPKGNPKLANTIKALENEL